MAAYDNILTRKYQIWPHENGLGSGQKLQLPVTFLII
jgi:hypothetical protein